MERIKARKAVKSGMDVPEPNRFKVGHLIRKILFGECVRRFMKVCKVGVGLSTCNIDVGTLINQIVC